jgi:hypothetical protein
MPIAHAQSLSQMLKALKTATESYLEASISAAEVTVPFPVSGSYLDSLRSACSSLSLHMPLSAQHPCSACQWHSHKKVTLIFLLELSLRVPNLSLDEVGVPVSLKVLN